MNSRPPQLRQAGEDDASALAGLMSQLGYPTTPVEMAERLAPILAEPDYRTLVADVSGSGVVGMVGVRRSHFYERNGTYGQIVALVVDQAWRGKQIGTALVAAAERWLQGQGTTVVLVNSGLARTEAHRFYQRQGYEATGVRFVKDLTEQASLRADWQV